MNISVRMELTVKSIQLTSGLNLLVLKWPSELEISCFGDENIILGNTLTISTPLIAKELLEPRIEFGISSWLYAAYHSTDATNKLGE